MYQYNKILDTALLAVIGYHLTVAPYTKVEESFNIQAIHDILNYGIYPQSVILDNYDHIDFPGVVPRTFIGSLAIAAIVKGINSITTLFGVNLLQDITQQRLLLVVRAVLGLANALALFKLRDSINRISRRNKSLPKGIIGFWFMVLLLTQFHLLYYASRTLPNFIALPLVVNGLSKILEGDLTGLTWIAFTGVVFRCEIGVFAVVIALVSSFVFGVSDIFTNLVMIVAGSLFGVFATFAVDSYFWNRFLLPEVESFFFNIVKGKSVEWGTEPWSAYFNVYIPKLFSPPVVLILMLRGMFPDPADDGTKREEKEVSTNEKTKEPTNEKKNVKPTSVPHPAHNSLRVLFTSSILFIVVMSFQPHKEWRFIIYVVPIFLVQAANGMTQLSVKWSSVGFITRVSYLVMLVTVVLTSFISIMMGYASSYNYPGGDALAFTNSYIESNLANNNVLVHMEVAPCMTGINKFGQLHSENVVYDKTEDKLALLKIWNDVNIAITADKIDPKASGELLVYQPHNWKLLHVSPIFKSFTIRPVVEIVSDDYGSRFALKVLRELLAGKVGILQKFLRSLVVTQDDLYVYLRVKKDKGLEKTIQEVERRVTKEKENILSTQERIVVAEKAAEDVDPKLLKEAVNAEIDELEEEIESKV